MPAPPDPLLTLALHRALIAAREAGRDTLEDTPDLGLSRGPIGIEADRWCWNGRRYPYADRCKERTVYRWDGAAFEPVSRFGAGGLIKLVPTDWGPPTFEIDGIKMLPTARVSPHADARHKVGLIEPRGKTVLDTCGGLGYFAHWCVQGGARRVHSFEKNPDVIWLRGLNPWSPAHGAPGDEAHTLWLTPGDVTQHLAALPDASFDAALHDPPRFGIAGELYAQAFYEQLARVLKPGARLFHYTGTPNTLTSGRDLPREVATRLQRAGFTARREGDGVLAVRGR